LNNYSLTSDNVGGVIEGNAGDRRTGLGSGIIAAIVCGCLLLLIAIACVIFFSLKKKKAKAYP